MIHWHTETPPEPGMYRVQEARAKVWFCYFNGRHWCVGTDDPRVIEPEQAYRDPPAAWANPGEFKDRTTVLHMQRLLQRDKREASTDMSMWWPKPRAEHVAASPEAVAMLSAWGPPAGKMDAP